MEATPEHLIRAGSILPAEREPITLRTSDGLALVGELASPLADPPRATLVTLHPLPTHGGFMDSHVYRKAAWRLPALADLAVVRFNTRGTASPAGTSEGAFDEGRGEGHDLRAALDFVTERGLPHPWLVGWSFGTDVVLKHGTDPRVEGAILLSPPLHFATDADLDRWAEFGRPLLILVPELDDYLRPDAARERFARIPQARVVAVGGARHLWVGEPYVRRVLDEIVHEVAPDVPTPLPTEFSGPMQYASNALTRGAGAAQ